MQIRQKHINMKHLLVNKMQTTNHSNNLHVLAQILKLKMIENALIESIWKDLNWLYSLPVKCADQTKNMNRSPTLFKGLL